MKYRALGPEEIPRTMSYRLGDLVEPYLEVAQSWRENTEDWSRPWKKVDISVQNGRVTFDGRPLHPYVLWRFTSHMLGVRKQGWDFWLANPDILASALRRQIRINPDSEVKIRAINGEVVFCVHLPQDQGHHIDFLNSMFSRLSRVVEHTKIPVGLAGYVLDPVWVHIRFLWLPSQASRSHEIGLYLDANHLFSKHLRGRAALGMWTYDFYWESSLVLDTWWSIRTERILRMRDMPVAFDSLCERRIKRVREYAKSILYKLTILSRRRTKVNFRQDALARYSHFIGRRYLMRHVLLRLEDTGRNSYLDLAFALSSTVVDYPLTRRMAFERLLSHRLKEVDT